MKKVVIIGGGIAGLTTAYNLVEHARLKGITGLSITIVERAGKIGGNIKTEKTDGFLIEGGPDCFLSEKPWALELCTRLGLTERVLTTRLPRGKTYVLSNGSLHLLPEGVILMVPTRMLPLITSSLISIPGMIRMGLELFVPKRKEKGDESLTSFVTRRLGREALDKIAEPLVAGVHAGDPDTMSVRASFPKFVELEEEHGSLIKGMLARMKRAGAGGGASGAGKGAPTAGPGGMGIEAKKKRLTMFVTIKGGLVELLDELLKKIGDAEIRTGKGVTGVKKKDGGFEVTLDGDGGSETLFADSVVTAVPAYSAAAMLEAAAPHLSGKLRTIPYVSTATVSLAYRREDIAHPLDGFGFVIPKTENRRIMAATWTTRKWEGRSPDGMELIRCFVGGAKNEELVGLDDAAMTAMVKAELKDIMGIDKDPQFVKIFRWIKAMPQYTIGHEERVGAIEADAAMLPGLFLTGSAFRGIGISDTVREAEITAKKVLKYLFEK